MDTIEYPYFFDPLPSPTPIYIHLTDIDSINSFLIFTDAAIRCHPFILIGTFTLSFFFIYIVTNYFGNKKFCNKGGE